MHHVRHTHATFPAQIFVCITFIFYAKNIKSNTPGKGCHSIHNIGIQPLHVVRPIQGDSGKQIEQKLKNLEKLWMNRLKRVFPQGLN